ncbi:hypothetical protein MKX08_005044 [Trichoderma sp. CBMAI-0020]|nr:hypothetical protein MKX08_005044 [Trichoderma sp. CBMAI-0020]WOD46649.1 hypothetical protein [Trichoderma atroviride]
MAAIKENQSIVRHQKAMRSALWNVMNRESTSREAVTHVCVKPPLFGQLFGGLLQFFIQFLRQGKVIRAWLGLVALQNTRCDNAVFALKTSHGRVALKNLLGSHTLIDGALREAQHETYVSLCKHDAEPDEFRLDLSFRVQQLALR